MAHVYYTIALAYRTFPTFGHGHKVDVDLCGRQENLLINYKRMAQLNERCKCQALRSHLYM